MWPECLVDQGTTCRRSLATGSVTGSAVATFLSNGQEGATFSVSLNCFGGGELAATPTPRMCLAWRSSIAYSSVTSLPISVTSITQANMDDARKTWGELRPVSSALTYSDNLQSWRTQSTSQTPLAINYTPTRSNSKRTSTTRDHGAQTPTISSMFASHLSPCLRWSCTLAPVAASKSWAS